VLGNNLTFCNYNLTLLCLNLKVDFNSRIVRTHLGCERLILAVCVIHTFELVCCAEVCASLIRLTMCKSLPKTSAEQTRLKVSILFESSAHRSGVLIGGPYGYGSWDGCWMMKAEGEYGGGVRGFGLLSLCFCLCSFYYGLEVYGFWKRWVKVGEGWVLLLNAWFASSTAS
jgi:hypothetical protein